MKSMLRLAAPAFGLAFAACSTATPPSPPPPVVTAQVAPPATVTSAPEKVATAPPARPAAAPHEAAKPRVERAPPKSPPSVVAHAKPQPAPPAKAPPPPGPAPLDLKSLEERLKDTHAIGLLTKLSLKNQVDDLIAKFRAYHQGERPPTLPELRPAFDLLLMKVLSLLQDTDPKLAHDINVSRDAIWGVLADKSKLDQFT